MKKLQIFISSTYIDLKEERQAAVSAILSSGNIPAGMELFKAGNTSQLEVIKRWIDESDVYMLILGGRYGSIEPDSGKSYTHLEYEYALEKGIPVFSVVLNDSAIYQKASKLGNDAMEQTSQDKLKAFKNLVTSKIVKFVDDEKDIKLSIHETLKDFERDNKLFGWVKGSELEEYKDTSKENYALMEKNTELLNEIDKLKKQLEVVKKKELIGDFLYEDLKELLLNTTAKFDKDTFKKDEDIKISYLQFIILYKDSLVTGFTNSAEKSSEQESYIYYHILPFIVNLGLVEKVKVAGVRWQRIQLSKNGNKFLTKLYLDADKRVKELD